jgi:tetratricopeptide (TPR) repeat protein
MLSYNQTYFEKMGVKITTDPLPPPYEMALHPIVRQALDLANARYVNSMSVAKMKKWIQQYPHVPQFKNYLSTLYVRLQQTQNAKTAALDCLEKHPHYVFGKLTLADIYILEKNYDKAAEVLDMQQDGAQVFGNQAILNESEWMIFNYGMLRIALAQDKMDLATQLAERAWLYDPKHKLIKPIIDELLKKRFEAWQPQTKSPNQRVSQFKANYEPTPTTQMPIFQHSIIATLYDYPLDELPETIMAEIMALPRATLIADLRLMLQDAVARKSVIFKIIDAFDPKKADYHPIMDIPVHAAHFLGALHAEEALEDLLNFMRQSDDALENWSSDLPEQYTIPLYFLGHNRLVDLQHFVLQGGNTSISKIVVSTAVAQVALQEPERRSEVIDWYKAVIQNHLDNPTNDYLIDSEFISFLISDIITIRGTELETDVERLFQTNWVETWIEGDWQSVQKKLSKKPQSYDKIIMPTTITEFYEMPPYNMEEEEEEDENIILSKSPFEQYLLECRLGKIQDAYREPITTQAVPKQAPALKTITKSNVPKVGRNDACPCGSGKKYKKCHGA